MNIVGSPRWLPEGDLVFQAQERVKLKPEEVDIEGKDWHIASRKIYRANMFIMTGYHQDQPRFALLSADHSKLITLAPDTWQVLIDQGTNFKNPAVLNSSFGVGRKSQEFGHKYTKFDIVILYNLYKKKDEENVKATTRERDVALCLFGERTHISIEN